MKGKEALSTVSREMMLLAILEKILYGSSARTTVKFLNKELGSISATGLRCGGWGLLGHLYLL